MIYIAPSLLAADFTRLGEDTARVEAAGADFLHLDVMDGIFVPNISFGPAVIGALRPQSKLVFDVHLMITAPERYVDRFIKAGADIISFHLEACEDPAALIKTIKAAGVKAAVAISPDTPAEAIIPYLADVDMALIMTVYPGFGGQKFMADMLPKIKAVREYVDKNSLDCLIQVDGGIDVATAPLVSAAGANVLVAGSAVFHADDAKKKIADIRSAAANNLYK